MSMTDFVLQQDITDIKQRDSIVNYANFLKQPLNLRMFVPCDEDGEILDEPRDYEQRLPNMMTEYNDEIYRYKQAKEKVLFENIPVAQAKWLVNSFSTIESLSDISNTITKIYLNNNAIKQIYYENTKYIRK